MQNKIEKLANAIKEVTQAIDSRLAAMEKKCGIKTESLPVDRNGKTVILGETVLGCRCTSLCEARILVTTFQGETFKGIALTSIGSQIDKHQAAVLFHMDPSVAKKLIDAHKDC